jgi:hypothetical protein
MDSDLDNDDEDDPDNYYYEDDESDDDSDDDVSLSDDKDEGLNLHPKHQKMRMKPPKGSLLETALTLKKDDIIKHKTSNLQNGRQWFLAQYGPLPVKNDNGHKEMVL